MSRRRAFLAACAIAVAGMVTTPSVAGAQPPSQASCLGVLSSFAGQLGTRDEFAPAPGAGVAALAKAHGDFAFCFAVFSGGGPTP